MYGDVVLGLKPESKDEVDPFEIALAGEEARARRHARHRARRRRPPRAGRRVQGARSRCARASLFPEDPREQLWGAIGAVFGSWKNDRAIVYRKLNDIPESWGTAVNVQSMVFGNMGDDSGTGVAFTRDPATGENVFYGEFLMNAQGEDVVAGIRTPLPIGDARAREPEASTAQLARRSAARSSSTTATCWTSSSPSSRARSTCCSAASGSAPAPPRSRIAVDMVERAADHAASEALLRVDPEQLNQLLRPIFDPAAKTQRGRRRAAARQGAQRRPGRGDRRRRLQRRGRRGAGGARRARHPGAHRDVARGHPRHGRRRGHPDRPRRHDQPRGARRRGRWARCASPAATRSRSTTSRRRCASTGRDDVLRAGRPDLDRRHRPARSSAARSPPSRARWCGCSSTARSTPKQAPDLPALRPAHEVGRQGPHARRAHQRRPARPVHATRSPSAPRASASAAPSTCSSARARSARCAR